MKKCKYHCDYGDGENCHYEGKDDCVYNKKDKKEYIMRTEDNGWVSSCVCELVRCKDCKWRGNKKKCIVAFVAEKQDFPYFFYDDHGEWFCADGERI